MTDQRKLELTLCDGLPHGLKFKWADKILTLSGLTKYYPIYHEPKFRGVISYSNITPILFDLSILTEEITIGGEIFVPITKLIELANTIGSRNEIEPTMEMLQRNHNYDWVPYWIVQKLKEWKFNIYHLDPYQFINVKDLEVNPYE